MTVLYEPWEPHARHLTAVLGDPVTVVDSPQRLVEAVAGDPGELLVVFGPSTALAEAVSFAEQWRLRRSALGVILLRQHLDPSVLAAAQQAGVREVVPVNDPEVVVDACARSVEVSLRLAALNGSHGPGRPGQGQVITVFTGKGGAGKSVLATNLAVALAAGGELRVGLIDLDLPFGDLALMMSLPLTRTIAAAIPVAERIDETGFRSLLTPHRSGVDVLLAPVRPAEAERVGADLVAELLRLARDMFDFVVVDCASAFSEQVLAALDAAHHYLLPATPELPALKSLRVTLDTFDQLDYSRDRRTVVLNRADSRAGLTHADIETAIRMPVAAHVPSSRDVPMSINRGTPIVLDQPNHPVSLAIRELVGKQFTGVAGRAQHRRWRGLTGRRTEARKG